VRATGLGASPARSWSVSGPIVTLPRVHGGLPDGDSDRRPGSFSPSGRSGHGRIRQVGRVEPRGYLDRRPELLSGQLGAGPALTVARPHAKLRNALDRSRGLRAGGRTSGLPGLEKPSAASDGGGLYPGGGVEFAQEAAHVHADCARADEQCRGYLRVGLALG